jgi:hypothetical protein
MSDQSFDKVERLLKATRAMREAVEDTFASGRPAAHLESAIGEMEAAVIVFTSYALSATRCTACGAKVGEPCRGNCERAMPSSIGASEEIDDPFCWYIVQRDITDEYSTVYSEAENCPGPGWKPLYERPVIPSATGARYLVRCGGECPQDWLCRDIPEVQAALCEALYGDPATADADDIGRYLTAVQTMPPEELKREWRFEDGWLEVIKIRASDGNINK